MKIRIRTSDMHLFVPIPLGLAGLVIRCIPQRAFEEARASVPEPYCDLITKENIRMLLEDCLDILKENKGLEIIYVEANDGTLISIKL